MKLSCEHQVSRSIPKADSVPEKVEGILRYRWRTGMERGEGVEETYTNGRIQCHPNRPKICSSERKSRFRDKVFDVDHGSHQDRP